MSKRDREEDSDLLVVAHDLEAAAGREDDAPRKQKALLAVRGLLDPADERYEAQRELSAAGALSALEILVQDVNEAVSVDAIETLDKVVQHSPAVLARLDVGEGFLLGNPDQVSFNPVQADAAEHGIVSALVGLYFSGSEEQQDAAWSALLALGAFNRPNKLAALNFLIQPLLVGTHTLKALGAVGSLLDNMPFQDDVAVILDQALQPLLAVVADGGAAAAEVREAARLLGTILAKRPAIADFLVGEGALPSVANLVATGDLETADAAVQALWLLVKGNRKLLRPEAEALGLAGTLLVKPLWDIILGTASDQANGGTLGPEEEADNGADAMLLLRALAVQDPAVQDKVKATDAAPSRPSCAIM